MADKYLKNSRQARTEATVGYISEATIQLLDAEQSPTFTTNHVAERAGVSIGTVYRYFANKKAILRFIGKREVTKFQRMLLDFIDESDAKTPHDFLGGFVEISMTVFGGRARATKRFRNSLETIQSCSITPAGCAKKSVGRSQQS